MKKLIAAVFLFALCLGAADFWQSKTPSEWSDKDVEKLMNNSPWARPFELTMSGPTPPNVGSPGGNSRGDAGPPSPISEGGGGGRGARGGGGEGPGTSQATTVVGRWQSALPLKQAFARVKYGADAATSTEAKQLVERQETSYIIVVSGPLRPLMRGNAETLKKAIMDASSLSSKTKDPLKPAELQLASSQKSVELVFYFPRTAAFTLADKEVEFSTRIGDVTLKYKFRLKEMVYNGKLEL